MKKVTTIVAFIALYSLSFTADAADIALKGVGGQLGLVMPEGEADTTFGLGVVGDLGRVIPQLRLEASAEYWGDSWEALGFEVSWSTITIGGTVKYDFPLNGNFTPFAGGGLGLAIGRTKSEWKGGANWWGQPIVGASTSDTDTDIGFHLVGGVDIPVGSNMKFTAQAKWAIDGADSLWLSGALLFQL